MEKSRRLACAMFTRPRTGGWDSTQLTSVNNPPLSALCWGVLQPATLCFLWCPEQCLLQTLRWVQCLQSLSLFARGKYSGPTYLFIFFRLKTKILLAAKSPPEPGCVCSRLWRPLDRDRRSQNFYLSRKLRPGCAFLHTNNVPQLFVSHEGMQGFCQRYLLAWNIGLFTFFFLSLDNLQDQY